MKYVFLLFALTAFSQLDGQELEARAQKFADLIADTGVSEKKYLKRIGCYFDPEANPDSTARAHCDHWKNNREENSYPISWKVVGAEYPSAIEGIVTTETMWHYPGGEEVQFVIATQWVRRGRKWYRTSKPQEIIESRQLN